MEKINKYIFLEIIKGCSLVFFIFLSVSWLLQFTRLISLTNLIQVDISTILIPIYIFNTKSYYNNNTICYNFWSNNNIFKVTQR